MKTSFVTAAVAVAMLASGAASAQPTQGQGQGRQGDQHPRKDHKGGEAATAPSPAAHPDRGKNEAGGPAKHPAKPGPAHTGAPPGQQRRAPEHQADRAPAPAIVQHRTPDASRTHQAQRPASQVRTAPPTLGAWSAPARGPSRDRANQEWRRQNQDWDRSAPWRQSQDWWRNDSSFRLFVGPRIGFFFVPQRGYITLPRQYRNYHWRAGQYLPKWFRAYSVSHYERYGLPRPPRGCVWIWLNGDVGLIDRSDGYILDIVHNVW